MEDDDLVCVECGVIMESAEEIYEVYDETEGLCSRCNYFNGEDSENTCEHDVPMDEFCEECGL